MNRIFAFAVNPLNAKFWFRVRTIVDFAITALICAFAVLIFTQFLPTWLADSVAIVLSMFLYAVVVSKRPIKVRCPNCQNIVLTNVPWVCGFCGATNKKPESFPFVHRCEQCGAEPKAYMCHHRNCGELIFLSVDHLESNFAYCMNTRAAPDPNARKTQRVEERLEKEHALQVEELEAKIEDIRKRREQSVPKNPLDQKKDSLDRHYAMTMAAREMAKKKKAEAAVTFKNDPEGLKDAEDAIDDWLERNIG